MSSMMQRWWQQACSLAEAGVGMRASRGKGVARPVWRAFAVAKQATVLVGALTVACDIAPAQHITGQQKAVSARAVVNMTGMAVFEEIPGFTNHIQKPIHAPRAGRRPKRT